MRIKRVIVGVLIVAAAAGCNLTAAEPTHTPTPEVTETDTPTVTATASASATPTATFTASATFTPSATPTITPTPSPTFTPTVTPQPVALMRVDNSALLDIAGDVRDGLEFPHVAYTVSNDRQTITNLSTAQPETGIVTLYFASPSNPAGRIEIVEVNSQIDDQFYIAPSGSAAAYLVSDPLGLTSGLYVADVALGLSARISTMSSFTQRERFSAPDFSPDGRRLAVAMATGYDLDIFLYDLDQAQWFNMTNAGSYDWAPQWSPDGRFVAFLSDRETCPSWIPGEGGCVAGVDAPQTAGHIYLFDVTDGSVTKVSEDAVVEPPRWITPRQLSFAVTDPTDILSQERTLYLADIVSETVSPVRIRGTQGATIYSSEAYSPDGRYVLLQNSTGSANQVVLMTVAGDPIATTSDLNFPRFGMAASWDAAGTRIVIGGLAGQCPFGRVVVDVAATVAQQLFVYTASPLPPNPTSMCEPVFSGDGTWAALIGVSRPSATAPDGREDIFVVNNNGYDQRNMTGTLRGTFRLLGWVGG